MKWSYEAMTTRLGAKVEGVEPFGAFGGPPLSSQKKVCCSFIEQLPTNFNPKECTSKTTETLSTLTCNVDGWVGSDARALPPTPPVWITPPDRARAWIVWWDAIGRNRRRHGWQYSKAQGWQPPS